MGNIDSTHLVQCKTIKNEKKYYYKPHPDGEYEYPRLLNEHTKYKWSEIHYSEDEAVVSDDDSESSERETGDEENKYDKSGKKNKPKKDNNGKVHWKYGVIAKCVGGYDESYVNTKKLSGCTVKFNIKTTQLNKFQCDCNEDDCTCIWAVQCTKHYQNFMSDKTKLAIRKGNVCCLYFCSKT